MKDSLFKNAQAKRLLQAFSQLDATDDLKRFLLDLCTPTEIEAMMDRLESARLIVKGLSYREIAEKTGASSATITRVGRTLKYGEKGYEKALQSIEKKDN